MVVGRNFGFDDATAGLIFQFDVVNLLTHSLGYRGNQILSGVCIGLMLMSVLNLVYVLREVSNSRVEHIWAVKMLKIVATVCVETLYPDMLEAALFPLSCQFWTSMDSKACEQGFWGHHLVLPLVGLVVLFFFLFALMSTYLFLEVNILTEDSLSAFHGRYSSGYLLVQTVVIILASMPPGRGFFLPLVLTAVAMCYISYRHLLELPLHHLWTNGYVFTLWTLLSWHLLHASLVALSASSEMHTTNIGRSALFGTVPIGITAGVAFGYRIAQIRGKLSKFCAESDTALKPGAEGLPSSREEMNVSGKRGGGSKSSEKFRCGTLPSQVWVCRIACPPLTAAAISDNPSGTLVE